MRQTLLISALVLAAPVVAAAQARDSGTFVIRLGTDTTAIERFVRTPTSLEAVLVQRSPRTAMRILRMTTGPNGDPRTLELRVLSAPELDAPARTTMTARFAQDSIRTDESQGGRTTQRSVAWQPGAVALVGGFYSPYETLLRRANRDSAVVPAVLNLAPRTFTVRRTQNGFALEDQFGQPLTLRTDASGRLVGAAGAGFSTAERVGWVDLPALAREFAGRDARSAGLGVLSPPDSVRTTIAGAGVRVDYSRPGRRGRPIFGQLVPWNEVWRTGANEATHLSSDRPLRFGSVTVPAGSYTLFSIPAPTGWQLIINKQTGQAGTEYDPAQDLARIPMRTRTLAQPVENFLIRVEPEANGGVLRLAWDRTEAFVSFTVLPPAR